MKITDENRGVLLNNYEVLSAYNNDYTNGMISVNHLGMEIPLKIADEQVFVFPVKLNNMLYAIPSEIIENGKLPIKIKKTNKVAYRSNVYHYVTGFNSVRIKEKEELNFRELIDTLCDFKHTTKRTDYTLYKIIAMVLYLRKGFARVVTEAGFGKTSVGNVLKTLMNDVNIINPRTVPAFELRLLSRLICLDELTNLEKGQRDLMQEVLLKIADHSVNYEKSSMGSSKLGTFNSYNISHLSLLLIFNPLNYYKEIKKADGYFDNIFQKALLDRFIPFYFEGVLDGSQFSHIRDPKMIAAAMQDDIKKIIRSIKYYQINFEKNVKDYKLNFEMPKLSKTGRMEKTFMLLCQGINLYSRTEQEYNFFVKKLLEAHYKYNDMIETEKKLNAIEEVDADE